MSEKRIEQRDDGFYWCTDVDGRKRSVTVSVGPFLTLEAAQDAAGTDVSFNVTTYCYPPIGPPKA